jgi:hypothetical protein
MYLPYTFFHFAILDDGGHTNEIANKHLQGNYWLNVFQDVQSQTLQNYPYDFDKYAVLSF